MLVAKILAIYLPFLGTALLALLLGVFVHQLMKSFHVFSEGVVWSEKYILETAIVFIGFGFEFSKFQEVGINTLAVIFFSILVIILISYLFHRFSRTKNAKLFLLLGIGSAICGSAAIGATSPIVQAKEEETGAALTVINLLGVSGMILLPIIGKSLGFIDLQLGIFLGGILQSMGHVVGSSFALSEEIGQYATLVKMGRIAFLVPFVLIIYMLYRKKNDGTKMKFPLFIAFFLFAVFLSQIEIIPFAGIKFLAKTGDHLLNIGMAAIGLKINLKSLWNISGKALIVGSIIFGIQLVIYLAYLILF